MKVNRLLHPFRVELNAHTEHIQLLTASNLRLMERVKDLEDTVDYLTKGQIGKAKMKWMEKEDKPLF